MGVDLLVGVASSPWAKEGGMSLCYGDVISRMSWEVEKARWRIKRCIQCTFQEKVGRRGCMCICLYFILFIFKYGNINHKWTIRLFLGGGMREDRVTRRCLWFSFLCSTRWVFYIIMKQKYGKLWGGGRDANPKKQKEMNMNLGVCQLWFKLVT